MCGIVATIRFDDRPVDDELLRSQIAALSHRGPDDEGVWVAGAVGLGHRRLSIIDLSADGREPIGNETRRIQLTFNGEVYNYRELRRELQEKGHRFRSRTDAEVVVHGYEQWGPECLSRLDGMFAFALWDGDRRRLLVARDRLGIKPLVYSHDARRFVCASELAALVADPEQPAEIDPVAIDHYLAFMQVPAPRTIYRGVHKLRPGHYLTVEASGELAETCWWQPTAHHGRLETSDEERVDRLDQLLNDSIRQRLVADVPVGVFLSGGLDSSLVTAIAARQRSQPLAAFSIAAPGAPGGDESEWARRVAAHVGARHEVLDVRPQARELIEGMAARFDEPFAISSALGVSLLARRARDEVKVVLTGDGGDEVFAGYPWRHTRLDADADRLASLPLARWRRREAIDGLDLLPIRWRAEGLAAGAARRLRVLSLTDDRLRERRYFNSLYCFNRRERQTLYADPTRAGAQPDDLLAAQLAPGAGSIRRWLELDIRTTLPDEMLAKVDRATMAWGLEARVPLLDHHLVDWALTLPPGMQARGSEGKIALRRLARRYLPDEIIDRPKQGFNLATGKWLRGDLRELVLDVLSPAAVARTGLFRPAEVAALVHRHLDDARVDLSNPILVLLWLELWRRTH